MRARASSHRLTFEEYLAQEQVSETRHELHDGLMLAIAGATRSHNDLTASLLSHLRAHLRGKPCRAYASGFCVRVEAANRGLYPDVLVACDDAARPGDLYTTAPRVIAGVLSPPTEAYDRGVKFGYYRQLESLSEYVLVDTRQVSVCVYRKSASGDWIFLPMLGPGDTLVLTSIGLTLPLEHLYEDALLDE